MVRRLRQQVQHSGDPALAALLDELLGYPAPTGPQAQLDGAHMGIAVPLRFRSPQGVLSFISTTTVFGTPVDITLQELAPETFFPADDFTGKALHELHA